MVRKVSKEKRLSKFLGLRLTEGDYQSLVKEAERMGLDVVSYIRMLVKTHPRRRGKA